MVLLKVAVCDDIEKELEKMKTALDAYEKAHPGIYFAVDEYQSALTILNAVKNEKTYDIALLDICMPGILGTDVAQEVLAKAPDTNIIFLTTSDEYAVDAFALNATHYLLKPFTQEKFDAAMDRAVEKCRRKRCFSLPVWTACTACVSVRSYPQSRRDIICFIILPVERPSNSAENLRRFMRIYKNTRNLSEWESLML